jgi:RHS repeat-associated protein
LLSRREGPSQAKVRSTTHRRNQAINDATAGSTGKKTIYTVNNRGERTSEAMPGHNAASSVGASDYDKQFFKIDEAGRLVRKTDQLGDTVQLVYDMADRVGSREYRTAANSTSSDSDGNLNGTIADEDEFTFDGVGRVLTAESGRYSNLVTRLYGFTGQLESDKLTIGGNDYANTFEYDAAYRPLYYTDAGGAIGARGYTPRNRLSGISYEENTVAVMEYDAGGRLSQTSRGGNTLSAYTYGRNDDLVTSIATSGLTYGYDYDANKNRTKEDISGAMDGYGYTGSTGTGYGDRMYDDEDRLLNWRRDNETTNGKTFGWDLTEAGDWIVIVSAAGTSAGTHNAAHEMTARTGPLAGNYVYDAKGNLTSAPGNWTYTWDFDNRLVSAIKDGALPTVIAEGYQYDALGRRVVKTPLLFGPSQPLIYSHFGDQVMTEHQGGNTLRRYFYGEYIDEPVAMMVVPNNSFYYYHRNALYSVIALSDGTGAVVERYAYDAYGSTTFHEPNGALRTGGRGNPPADRSAYGNPYLYTGRAWDPVTKLYHYRARYYQPTYGRFISRDPIAYEGSEWNLYEYVASRSLRFGDPFGLSPLNVGIGHYGASPGYGFPVDPNGVGSSLGFACMYMNGCTAPQDLDSHDLLDDYQNADEVKDFRNDMGAGSQNPSGNLSCTGNKSVSWSLNNTRLVNAQDGVFAMGHGYLNAKGSCTATLSCVECCDGTVIPKKITVNCTVTFSITDRFKDPLDIGIDVQPGFDMTANWTESTTSETELGECPE